MGRISSRVPRRRHAVRRLSSCLALAAAAGLTGQAFGAGTTYTWTGAGGDSLWSDAANWNPNSGYPNNGGTIGTAGSGDTAVFTGTGPSSLSLNGGNYSLGGMIFSTTNNWQLGTDLNSTLTLDANGSKGATTIDASGLTGTLTIDANLALPVSETFLVGPNGTLNLNGWVGSPAGTAAAPNLTFGGGGRINYDAAAPPSGIGTIAALTVSGGTTLDVNGAGVYFPSTSLVLSGGTAIADNSAQNFGDRFGLPGNPYTTTLNAGTFVLKGNSSADTQEYLGDTTIGAGLSTITVSTAGGTPTLTLNTLNRSTGSGILFVNGTGLGTAGSPDGVIFNGQIVVTGGVAGTGSAAAGTGPQAGTTNQSIKNLQILPYVIGEVPDSSGAIGTQTGVPDTFVALASGNYLRPLNPADEYSHTLSSAVNGNNIYIDSPTTATTASINSLVINNADLTIGNSQSVADAGGALLFVTSNNITASGGGSSGTFTLGNPTENIIAVNSGVTGTISAPLTGSAPITYAGPGQLNLTSGSSTYGGTITVTAGALQFGPGGSIPATSNVIVNGGTLYVTDGSNTGYTGTITVNNSSVVQFGRGTAGNDGALGNASGTIVMGNSGSAGVAIDNVGPTTFNSKILTPSTGVNGNIYVVGPGAVTFNGNIDMESGPGAPFMWLHGGAGGGAITINGNITQNPAVTQAPGSTYFYVATNGGVTFNGNIAGLTTDLYMEGIPLSVVYGGLTTPTTGGAIPNIGVTLSSTGSVGNGFANNNPNTPNPNSPSGALTVTNMNRSGANLGTLPPPTVFNQNGPINASTGSSTTWDGYYSGVTVWNVNAPLAVSGSLGIDFDSHGDGTAAPFGIMNVAPGQTVTVAPFSSNSQTGFLLLGYGNYSADVIAGSYGYLRAGAGASINNNGNKGTTYIGYQANALLDLTNLNNDGSTGAGSTLNTYYQVTINGGGFQTGQASVANLYPGSTLNMHSVTSTPNVANNTGAAEYPSGTAAYGNSGLYLSMNSVRAAGIADTAILNVMGGTLNNANSVAGTGANYSPAINMYGNTGNDNFAVNALPTAIVNISNGGLVRTGYIRAETIKDGSFFTDAANFVNFGGYNPGAAPLPGELDYNQANSSQGTFIQYGVAGVYIYSGGAVIGTSIDNTNFTANAATVVQGLMAAPGKGVASIALPGGPIGSGYSAAPVVLVKDAQGFDATAYAVVDTTAGDANYGKITSIVVTNPGFNFDSSATLSFIGGGGTAPTTGYTINLTPPTSSGFQTSGGLTKLDAGTLTLVGTYNGTNSTNTSLTSVTSAGTAAAVGLGNIPAIGAGNAGTGVRNNTSTYAGPTIIEAGTLALTTATSTAVTGQTATFPATNNNIPYSSMIVVGDIAADSGAILNTAGIGAAGGFQLGPNQILAGFGTVKGTGGTGANNGVTIGAATGGNNFGGGNGTNGMPAIAANGAGSMIAPGISPAIGTAQGHVAGSNTPVTGALTLTSSSASPMTTTFGAGGTYYWKLNLATGGTTNSTPGANWDQLQLDSLAVTSTTSSPFTIQAVSFGTSGGGSGGVNIGGSNTTGYSWIIAHANDASISASILGNLALNSSQMPSPASGYNYSLDALSDPSGGTDLVVVYAPAPEPTALMLLAPAAGAMLLRRRRNAGRAEQMA